MSWTSERVIALAPDSSSLKSGRELANAHKWVTIARNAEATALWGECQGSGKLPYQAQIDVSAEVPSFKCSCPSRKFPCKHGLGLLLLYAQDPKPFKVSDPPGWVSEWLEKRSKRAEIKAEKPEKSGETDKAAQEKRLRAREKKVSAGLDDLSLWLRDLIRTGLANVQGKPYDFWETTAKRLIDAQASGLARRVRELPLYLSGDNWTHKLLEQLSLIHLLIEAYKRLDTLSPAIQADVRTAIGFTQTQDELSTEGNYDLWRVYGQVVTEEDRLRARRIYLRGQTTECLAMLLEFAHAQQPFATTLSGFEAYEGEVVYYPSNYPQRAILKAGSFKVDLAAKPVQAGTLTNLLEDYSEALSKNPWTQRIACQIQACPEPFAKPWTLRDQNGMQLQVHPTFGYWYLLLEESGGQALNFFGEWDGEMFLPLLCTHPVTHETLYFLHGGVA